MHCNCWTDFLVWFEVKVSMKVVQWMCPSFNFQVKVSLSCWKWKFSSATVWVSSFKWMCSCRPSHLTRGQAASNWVLGKKANCRQQVSEVEQTLSLSSSPLYQAKLEKRQTGAICTLSRCQLVNWRVVSLVSRPFDYIKIGHWSHLDQWSCVSSNLVSLGRVINYYYYLAEYIYTWTALLWWLLCLSLHCTFPLETSVLLKSVALVNCQGSQCIKPSGASRAKKVSDKYINLEAQVGPTL